jgi:CxxC motif-containing protein
MAKEIVCIVCPMGCRMGVEFSSGGEAIGVTGNTCGRGRAYALSEATSPKRTLPTTVRIKNAFLPRLPVRTASPIPKEALLPSMEEIRRIEVSAPVSMGEVIMENVAGTGIALLASRSMSARP